MPARARLLLPPPALSSCISAAVLRDTRGTSQGDPERLNYFPASPLFAVTLVMEGQLQMARGLTSLDLLRSQPALPRISVTAPQDDPIVSWSPGPVTALTLAIYPDAWAKLGGQPGSNAAPDPIIKALQAIKDPDQVTTGWDRLSAALTPQWQAVRRSSDRPDWSGSDRLADWTRHMLAQIALRAPGRSARTLERILRRWTGQSRQSLSFYAKIEELHRLRQQAPDAALAEIAHDAAFSDQSHMGRAVRRATGFSPAQLNHLIDTQEAFWCYRLLGERF